MTFDMSSRRRWASAGFAVTLMSTAVPAMARAEEPATQIAQSGDELPTTSSGTQVLPQGGIHHGVVTPPPTGDAAINKGAPPASDFPTPVIPPAGTAGGNTKVVPK